MQKQLLPETQDTVVIDFKYKMNKSKAKLIIGQPKAKTFEANPQLKIFNFNSYLKTYWWLLTSKVTNKITQNRK